MVKSHKYRSFYRLLAPKYWPAWVNIGLIKVLGYSSLKTAIALGSCLGSLFYYLAKRRRYIAEINLKLCYPEYNKQQKAQLIRAAMQNTVIGLFEIAIGWVGDLDKYCSTLSTKGLDQVLSYLKQNKPIILIGSHQTTLDIGLILLGKTLGNQANLAATYRVYPNFLFNQFMVRSRTRYLKTLISSRDIRAMANFLKKQYAILWIAVDQDVGGKSSVYAPFFGASASTHVSVVRLASMTGAAVFTFASYRKELSYELEFQSIKEIPSGDLYADAKIQNEQVEQVIKKNPEQYLWMHRRFKTQIGNYNYYE